jgi:predicted porin
MNKWVIGVALAAACSSAAHAQSAVTVYGFLYSGLRYVNNSKGDSVTGLATGPSRWGMKGTEDLGDGRSAVFNLESGLDISTGTSRQGGRLFGRQAFVGLSDVKAGTLTLGRQYDMVASFIAPYAAVGKWNGYMAHVGDNDNLNFQFRLNNSVKYVSPDVGGFQAGAVYSFGEAVGSSKPNSASSAGLRYRDGNFSAAASYLRVNNPATAVPEGNWNTILFPALTSTSAINPYSVQPDAMTTYGLAADYQWGKAKYALVYTQSQFDEVRGSVVGLPVTDVRYRNIEANIAYSVTNAWVLGASYTFTTGKVDATDFKPKYHQVNLMTNYFLSKRTILQLAAIRQQASGDAQNAYILFSSGSGASSSRSQTSLLAGIFHVF